MALAHILQEDGSARRMPTSIPYTQLAAVVQQLHRADPTTPSTRTLRRDMQKDVEDLANHNTPYGKLVQTLDLGIADGQIPFINPFALLFWMSCACVEFGDMLRQSVTDRARIVFYCDETKAGNVLRPDEGRGLQCIYWTLMDIPSWFRVRKFGWFTVSVIRSKLVKSCKAESLSSGGRYWACSLGICGISKVLVSVAFPRLVDLSSAPPSDAFWVTRRPSKRCGV